MVLSFLKKFSKRNPTKVHNSIARKIVAIAQSYRKGISASNIKLSTTVGAGEEMVYLLIHFVDRQVFNLQLDLSRRAEIFEHVSQIASIDYLNSVYNTNVSQDVLIQYREQMLDTLDSRQITYSRCKCFFNKSNIDLGSAVFAFSCFVQRAIGYTNRSDKIIDELVSGPKGPLSDGKGLDDFLDIEEIMKATIAVASAVDVLKLENDLKYLR